MDNYLNMTCGDCIYFTGEECDGYYEGSEAYDDDTACSEFELKKMRFNG